MKPTILVLVAVFGFAAAQREQSLAVIEALRRVQPVYRDLQNFVVNAVSSAKLNSSQAVFDFHGNIFAAKDTFLRAAISKETATLFQINGQVASTQPACLNLLRESVTVNMNLAGVSFTNCILAVDARLGTEINQIYSELQINETAYIDFSIYDVFQQQNIFINPDVIIELLQSKLGQLQAPLGLIRELSDLIDSFRSRLEVVRVNYNQCLTTNDNLLQTAISTILIQLQQICLGSLIATGPPQPGTPMGVMGPLGPLGPQAVQPEVVQWT
ncbi:uncharacterized protein LOC129744592 [Uranotaenia lowii]|uniref:uncharacterized protein LOC129744592 n=1 Tax=Uranotaenia lowii TaxID=190385 RepID=UPI002478B538|nr:uncharacterized protein LOC129744592 [Uranotaenia lowii]